MSSLSSVKSPDTDRHNTVGRHESQAQLSALLLRQTFGHCIQNSRVDRNLLLFFDWHYFLSKMVHKSESLSLIVTDKSLRLSVWEVRDSESSLIRSLLICQKFHYPLSVVSCHMIVKLIISAFLRIVYKSITGKRICLKIGIEITIFYVRHSPNIAFLVRECPKAVGHWNRQRSGHRFFQLEFRIHYSFIVHNDQIVVHCLHSFVCHTLWSREKGNHSQGCLTDTDFLVSPEVLSNHCGHIDFQWTFHVHISLNSVSNSGLSLGYECIAIRYCNVISLGIKSTITIFFIVRWFAVDSLPDGNAKKGSRYVTFLDLIKRGLSRLAGERETNMLAHLAITCMFIS